jgi:hypothetical protein
MGGNASISGALTFPDGSHAARKIVEWRPAGDPNGGSTVLTDEKGGYVIEGLKAGLYYVGFFDPTRLPSTAEKNQGVEQLAEESETQQPDDLFVPVGRKITLKDGESVAGVDFVITDIGDENVIGPDTSAEDVGALPATGGTAAEVEETNSSGTHTGLLIAAATALAAAVLFSTRIALKARR